MGRFNSTGVPWVRSTAKIFADLLGELDYKETHHGECGRPCLLISRQGSSASKMMTDSGLHGCCGSHSGAVDSFICLPQAGSQTHFISTPPPRNTFLPFFFKKYLFLFFESFRHVDNDFFFGVFLTPTSCLIPPSLFQWKISPVSSLPDLMSPHRVFSISKVSGCPQERGTLHGLTYVDLNLWGCLPFPLGPHWSILILFTGWLASLVRIESSKSSFCWDLKFSAGQTTGLRVISTLGTN